MDDLTDDYLRRQISALTPLSRATFACSCCERMELRYRAYAIDTRYEEVDLLHKLLLVLWQGTITASLHDDFGRGCSIIPLDDAMQSPFLSMAQQAIGAVLLASRVCLNPETSPIQNVYGVSSLSIETVRDWVSISSRSRQGMSQADVELRNLAGLPKGADSRAFSDQEAKRRKGWIASHPLVVAEAAKQAFDLQVLTRVDCKAPEVIALLRESLIAHASQPLLSHFVHRLSERP